MPLPNWPSAPPDSVDQTPVNTGSSQSQTFISAPIHNTIQEARESGVEAGTIVAAPLVPATGKIQQPAESVVAVAVKSFWDSPTIKWARNIIGTAVLAVLGVFTTACMSVWSKGESIFAPGAIDWHATEVSAEVAAGMIIGAAILAYKKTKDNNPVK